MAPRGEPSEATPMPDPAAGLGAVARAALARDRALLARWRDGDRDAGLELLDHYAAYERMIAFRLGVRGSAELLELHQEVVLRVLDRLPRLADELDTSFGGWLAWQVRDLAQRQRRERAGATAPLVVPDIETGDPSERAIAWEAISNCKGRLPERERAVFELRYVEGLSLQEVADRVASNANAVAQSVFRLVRRMRACLSTQGYELRGEEA